MQAFLRHLKWPFFFSFSLCWSFPSTEYRWISLQYLGGLVHYNQEIHFWNKAKFSSQHLLFPNRLVGGLHRKENTYFWNPEKTLWREQKCCWLKKWQIVSSLHHPKTHFDTHFFTSIYLFSPILHSVWKSLKKSHLMLAS